jgi:hypothetical protein
MVSKVITIYGQPHGFQRQPYGLRSKTPQVALSYLRVTRTRTKTKIYNNSTPVLK